jgi:hypothetical protein
MLQEAREEDAAAANALCLTCCGDGYTENDVLTLTSLTLSQTIRKRCVDCGGSGSATLLADLQASKKGLLLQRQMQSEGEASGGGDAELVEEYLEDTREETRDPTKSGLPSWGLFPDMMIGLISHCLSRIFGLLLIIATKSTAQIEEIRYRATAARDVAGTTEATRTEPNTDKPPPTTRSSARSSLLQFQQKPDIGKETRGSRATLRKRSTTTALTRKMSGG